MIRFGRFEFHAESRRLTGEGGDVHLAPKTFDLLAVLLEAAPRVVAKRELHARLWPGGSVADATLIALVKQLRTALGDRDRKAPLIRTVHRVGYALELPRMAQAEVLPVPSSCWIAVGQRRHALINGDNIIGRDVPAGIRLDNPVISRRHACIAVGQAGATLEDLGSKNGTFVDDQRVSCVAVPLKNGARLAFGTVLVTFGDSSEAVATLTHAGRP